MFKQYIYIGYDFSAFGFKIGRTNNVTKREEQIRNMNPTYVMLVDLEVQDSYAAEKAAHSRYAHKRFVGEWFDLTAQDVVDIVKKIDPSHPINVEIVRLATGRKDI